MSHYLEQIELLRREMNNEIKKCNFGAARSIEEQIQKILQENQDAKKETNFNSSLNKFESAKNYIMNTYSSQYGKAVEEISKKKEIYQKRLSAMQDSYSRHIEKLENDRTAAIELASTRRVSEAEILIKQAQILAKAKDFDAAERTLEEANQIKDCIINQRINELQIAYNTKREEIAQRFKEDRALCLQKLKESLRFIKEKHDLDIIAAKKALNIQQYKVKNNGEISNEYFEDLPIDISEFENDNLSVTISSPNSPKRKSRMVLGISSP